MNGTNRRRNRGAAAGFFLAFGVAGSASAQMARRAVAPVKMQGVPAMAGASLIGTLRLGQSALYDSVLTQALSAQPIRALPSPAAAQAALAPRTDGPEAHASLLPNWIDRPTLYIESEGRRDLNSFEEAEELKDVVDEARARTPVVGAGQAVTAPAPARHVMPAESSIPGLAGVEKMASVGQAAARDRAFDGRAEGSAVTGKTVEAPKSLLTTSVRSARIMSPVAFAQANLASGVEVTQLMTGRGGIDLLKNPHALAKYKVGEFKGEESRGGRLTNTVYKVPLPGADDAPEQHIIVRVAFAQSNDTVGYKYVDVGVMDEGTVTSRAASLKAATAVEAPAENYAWTVRAIERGAVFSGNGLPTVSVTRENAESIQATIDGKQVAIEFVSAPDGLPLAMVLRGTGGTLTVDLDKEPPTVMGTMSGETLSATSEGANIIIRYGTGRFRQILGKSSVSLAGLQAGDVPEPVRRFAAYMLVLVATMGG
jgi:hypothetical protein